MKAIFCAVIVVTLGIIVDAKVCNKMCTLEINRVCGTDGYSFKIFPNKCVMDVQACEDSTVWRAVKMSDCRSLSQNFIGKDRKCAYKCTKEFNPECGYNGESYKWFNNGCSMKTQSCLDGKSWIKTVPKACQHITEERNSCSRNCTNIHEPVCGFNGNKHQIFDSECLLQQQNCKNNSEWKMLHMDDCLDTIKFPQLPPIVCRKPCPKIYNPVCGYDGVSYRKFSTECVMENQKCENEREWVRTKLTDCDGNTEVNTEENKSECATVCNYRYEPVCGFDGNNFKIFANKCILKKQHCVDSRSWRLEKMRKCLERSSELITDCPIACPLNYNPVCGFNGRKYKLFANDCQYRFASCRSNYGWEKANITACDSFAFH